MTTLIKGKKRERATGQEMLHRLALMLAGMLDNAGDRDLPIGPAMHGNAGDASHCGARAIRADQQRDIPPAMIGLDEQAVTLLTEGADDLGADGHSGISQSRTQHLLQQAKRHEMGKRLTLCRLEAEADGPDIGFQSGIGERNRAHGMRFGFERRPDTEGFEEASRTGIERENARIGSAHLVLDASHGIDHGEIATGRPARSMASAVAAPAGPAPAMRIRSDITMPPVRST